MEAVSKTSEYSISASDLKELKATREFKNGNGSKTSSPPASKTSLSKDDGGKCGQNGTADVKLCPKDHICHKCCFGPYGCSSIFYGTRDEYVPESSGKFTKHHQSTYKSEAVMDEAGIDTGGNWWLGSHHY
ncbi:hypothetical protein QQ045_030652 [Rhodiola kirilowii]